MSVFSKVGAILVESVPQEPYEDDTFQEEDPPSVDMESVESNTLVSDIYEKNDMCNFSHSIFKAEELIGSLPNTMATDVKRKSVLSILNSFDITADEIIDDGVRRLSLLVAANGTIDKEGADFISRTESQIEACKVQITEMEKRIAEKKAAMKTSEETIQTEASRIDSLVKFIGG